MKEINLPPFYVGQRVVCVKDNSSKSIKKGQEFSVLGLNQFSCGCWSIDIGIKSESPRTGCGEHGLHQTAKCNNGIKWFHVKLFAPIEQTFQPITLEKVLEIETKLVSAN